MRILLVPTLLLFASFAGAETYTEIVERAFAAVDQDLSRSWAYTETTENSEGLFVARFDPRLDTADRWTLQSVDGRDPTAKEIEAFRKEKTRDRDRDDDDDDSMVADGSLELLEETDTYWSFSFRPRTESDEEFEFMQSVEGQLQVIKDGHYVSRVTMRNTKPIKPGMGVKIKVFETTLQFAPAFEAGPVLPRSVRVAIEGRALLVAKIEETESVEFSDYERVVD